MLRYVKCVGKLVRTESNKAKTGKNCSGTKPTGTGRFSGTNVQYQLSPVLTRNVKSLFFGLTFRPHESLSTDMQSGSFCTRWVFELQFGEVEPIKTLVTKFTMAGAGWSRSNSAKR